MSLTFTVNGITCSKCRLYSPGLRRCMQGRCLPKSIKECVKVAKLLGIGALCSQITFDAHKTILERMRAS